MAKPFIVRSVYRSPGHNRAVGRARRPKHLKDTASDIAMSDHDPAAFEAAAREAASSASASSSGRAFIHIDLGPKTDAGDGPHSLANACAEHPRIVLWAVAQGSIRPTTAALKLHLFAFAFSLTAVVLEQRVDFGADEDHQAGDIEHSIRTITAPMLP